jgi:hypothetical protein
MEGLKRRGVIFPEMDWFLANIHELAEQYPREWLAIKGQEVRIHTLDAAELRNQIRGRELGAGERKDV